LFFIKNLAKTAQKTVKRSSAPTRLWVKGRFLSFRRSRDRLECQQSLVKLQDVNDRKGLRYYHGKRVAYVYRAHKTVANTKYRVIWGKIMRAHGDNGLALCGFRKNLPARAIGDSVRVFLYPQRGQSVLTQA
jgi:large subunit ribosomal protein L35Ae